MSVSGFIGCSRDPKVRRDRYLQSGQRYFDKNQFDAASIEFRRAAQVDPHSAEAYYRLGLASLKLRQWQDAYQALNKALVLEPRHIQARLELAELELAARQTGAARSDVEKAFQEDPNSLRGHLLLGEISLIEKDYKQALEDFGTSQKIAPNDPVSYGKAGDIYMLLKQYPEAEQAFEKAISLNTTYLPAYLDLAQVYRVEGNTNAQLGTLQDAIQKNPKQIAPYIALASTYVQLGQNDRVTETFSDLRRATGDASGSLLAIGEFYFAAGDVSRAREVLTDGLAKDARNNSIRRRLIELSLSQHDWDKAEKLDQELLKAEPKDPAGRMFKARLEFERGAKTTAVSTLEQLVHDVPEMALPHFYLGLAYAGEGEAGRAIAAMNDTLQHDSNFIWAYVTMGELHLKQGSPKLAQEFASKALQLNPNFVPAIILQSNAYMQTGDYANATARLEKISAAQPKNSMLLERLAVADIYQKQFTQAEQRLEAALQTQPDYVQPMVDLIQLYAAQNRTERIIPRLQQQIERAPKQADFYELSGDAYLAKADLKSAEQDFDAALKLNSDSIVSRLQLARVYAAENRLSEAIRMSQDVVQKNPDYLSAQFLLGTLYERASNIPEAEQAYQQAIQKNGEFVPALNNLAWLLCENGGNLDMALSLAERAKAKVPNDPSVSDTLAWIQYRKGLYSLALDEFRELTKKSPQNAVYKYHLGMTLLSVGKDEEARASLQQALSSQLGPTYASEARAVLAKMN